MVAGVVRRSGEVLAGDEDIRVVGSQDASLVCEQSGVLRDGVDRTAGVLDGSRQARSRVESVGTVGSELH
jgi:hypothetical protein